MKKRKLIAICMLVLVAMLSTSVAMLIPVGAETANEAKIGTAEYATLEAAVADAASGAIIELLTDVELEDAAVPGKSAGLLINKSLTINGNGKTITNHSQRGIYIVGGADEASKVVLSFNNVNVFNHTNTASVRCFDIRGGRLELNLNGVKLEAVNKGLAVAQPITVGGGAENTVPVTVNLEDCEILSGKPRSTDPSAANYDEELGFVPGYYGYAVYACNPVNLTAKNTKFDAWAAIYLAGPNGSYGSKTSTVTLEGCEVNSINDHSQHQSNSFGAFVVEDADSTLNIKDTAVNVSTRFANIPAQPVVLLSNYNDSQASNANVSISGNTVVTGVKDSTRLVWDITEPAQGESNTNSVQISGGTYNVAVPDEYCAPGFAVTARPDGNGSTVYGADETAVAKSTVMAQIDAKKAELYKDNRYTDANKAQIEALYESAKAAVTEATAGTAMNEALNVFMTEVVKVEAISLDTLKADAIAKLEAAKAELLEKNEYTAANLEKIEKAFDDAKTAIENAETPDEVEVASATYNTTVSNITVRKPLVLPPKDKDDGIEAWVIVLIAVGGAVVLAAVVAIVVLSVKKKKSLPVVVVEEKKKVVVSKSAELTDAQRAAIEADRRRAEKKEAMSAPAEQVVEAAPVEEPAREMNEVTPAQETVAEPAEEMVEEAAVEQAAPKTVEVAPAQEPIAEKAPVSEEKKALFDSFAAIASKSFTERLENVDPEAKAFYEQIKAELLSYDKVKTRLSQKGESFRVGRVLLAKIAISGKTVKCYLALDPAAYDVKTYRHSDASERKAFADVPMLIRIRSKLSVKRTTLLIADLAAANGLVKK